MIYYMHDGKLVLSTRSRQRCGAPSSKLSCVFFASWPSQSAGGRRRPPRRLRNLLKRTKDKLHQRSQMEWAPDRLRVKTRVEMTRAATLKRGFSAIVVGAAAIVVAAVEAAGWVNDKIAAIWTAKTCRAP